VYNLPWVVALVDCDHSNSVLPVMQLRRTRGGKLFELNVPQPTAGLSPLDGMWTARKYAHYQSESMMSHNPQNILYSPSFSISPASPFFSTPTSQSVQLIHYFLLTVHVSEPFNAIGRANALAILFFKYFLRSFVKSSFKLLNDNFFDCNSCFYLLNRVNASPFLCRNCCEVFRRCSLFMFNLLSISHQIYRSSFGPRHKQRFCLVAIYFPVFYAVLVGPVRHFRRPVVSETPPV